MSYPVDPPPDEIDPSGPAPVWDRHGARWSWNDSEKSYVCEDESYTGPGVNVPGAIPDERQPFYAHPPTELEQALAEEDV